MSVLYLFSYKLNRYQEKRSDPRNCMIVLDMFSLKFQEGTKAKDSLISVSLGTTKVILREVRLLSSRANELEAQNSTRNT